MAKGLNRELIAITRSQSPDNFRRDRRVTDNVETGTPEKLLMLDHLNEMKRILADMEKLSLCKKQAE